MSEAVACVLCILLCLLCACTPAVPETSADDSSSPEQPPVTESSREIEISLPGESSGESVEASDAPSEDSPGETSEPETNGWKAYRSTNEVRVEAYAAPPVPETGFSLTTTSLNVGVGKKALIRYAFTPIGTSARKLTFVSSDPTVAQVSDSGFVTGVGEGTTQVTVTTPEGRKATCRVTVSNTETTLLGALIDRITGYDCAGWYFCYVDADFDGEKDLLARREDPNGIASKTAIYRVSDGEQLCAFDTGEGESWAVWAGNDGSRFLLGSFKSFPKHGVVRYSVDLVRPASDGSGKLELRHLYCRDDSSNGINTFGVLAYYTAGADGTLGTTNQEGYDAFRTDFNAKNKQKGSDLKFVTGTGGEGIAASLRKT